MHWHAAFRSNHTLLLLAAGLDGGDTILELGGTAGGAAELERLNNTDRLNVSNLAEDDVAAVEPRGHDGGDEELRAVAVGKMSATETGKMSMG